jgi:tetratricopeptide (TPR) repeat protein
MQVSQGNSLWAPIAAMTMLSHHCFAEFIVGFGHPDLVLVSKILEQYRTKYPGSGFFLVYEGTLRLMKGEPEQAIEYYEKSIEKFVDWHEWQYACHWFITWCYAIMCDWPKALHHTKILMDNCNWSKCIFTYQYAAMLKMIEEDTTDPDKKAILRKEIDHHLRTAPSYKRNFVGKTIWIEKFVTKRCEIYWKEVEKQSHKCETNNNNDEDLSSDAFMLPILDLFLFWNIFYTFKASPTAGTVFLKKVNDKLKVYPEDATSSDDLEKHFYLVLMKGVILKNMGDHDAAIECLTSVLDNEHLLKRYSHLAPLACLELGTLFKQIRDHKLAEVYLHKAMNGYSHYLNETAVHIRAHAMMETMRLSDLRKLSSASINSLASKLSFVFFPPGENKN